MKKSELNLSGGNVGVEKNEQLKDRLSPEGAFDRVFAKVTAPVDKMFDWAMSKPDDMFEEESLKKIATEVGLFGLAIPPTAVMATCGMVAGAGAACGVAVNNAIKDGVAYAKRKTCTVVTQGKGSNSNNVDEMVDTDNRVVELMGGRF